MTRHLVTNIQRFIYDVEDFSLIKEKKKKCSFYNYNVYLYINWAPYWYQFIINCAAEVIRPDSMYYL